MNNKEYQEMLEDLRQQREEVKDNPKLAFETLERYHLLTPAGRKKALQAIKKWERKNRVSR